MTCNFPCATELSSLRHPRCGERPGPRQQQPPEAPAAPPSRVDGVSTKPCLPSRIHGAVIPWRSPAGASPARDCAVKRTQPPPATETEAAAADSGGRHGGRVRGTTTTPPWKPTRSTARGGRRHGRDPPTRNTPRIEPASYPIAQSGREFSAPQLKNRRTDTTTIFALLNPPKSPCGYQRLCERSMGAKAACKKALTCACESDGRSRASLLAGCCSCCGRWIDQFDWDRVRDGQRTRTPREARLFSSPLFK